MCSVPACPCRTAGTFAVNPFQGAPIICLVKRALGSRRACTALLGCQRVTWRFFAGQPPACPRVSWGPGVTAMPSGTAVLDCAPHCRAYCALKELVRLTHPRGAEPLSGTTTCAVLVAARKTASAGSLASASWATRCTCYGGPFFEPCTTLHKRLEKHEWSAAGSTQTVK